MKEKAHSEQMRKLRFALIDARRHLPAGLPPLFALTDPIRTPDPLVLAHKLPEGCGLIYRHFGALERLNTAQALAHLARQRHLILLIGNDPALALAVGASGVHWPEAHLPSARRWRGRFQLMTGAVHSARSIRKAEKAGLQAALLSTVFPSTSQSSRKPMGPMAFRRLARTSHLPLYALGGVNPQNMRRVSHFGGIAAIDGISALE